MKKHIQTKEFWLSIGLFLIVGLLSGLFALDARTYYSELTQPFFAPPGFLFGPVWTILYILIGIAYYFLHCWETTKYKKRIQVLFYAQFFLNVIWSLIFFSFRNTTGAMIDIILLLGILVVLQFVFWKHDRKIFALMTPYVLWVSFATVLTIGIFILN